MTYNSDHTEKPMKVSPVDTVRTFNLKCPACGQLTPKTLDAIKAQQAFDCDCGFHAPIATSSAAVPARQPMGEPA